MLHLALVFFIVVVLGLLLFVGLLEGAKHVLLQGLFFENEAVLIPDKVGSLNVESIAFHAGFEQLKDVAVVGVSGEGE